MEAAVAAAAQPARGGNSRFSVRLSSAHTLPAPSSSLGNSALTSTVKMTGSERQGLFILIYREKEQPKHLWRLHRKMEERIPLLFQKSKLLIQYVSLRFLPIAASAASPVILPQAAHLENTL